MITSGQLIQQTAILSLILAAGGIVSSFFNSRRRGRVFAFFAGTVGLCSTVLMLINDSRPDDFEYKLGSMEFSLDAISIFFIATIGLGIFFFSLFNASLAGNARAYEQKNHFYYCILGIFCASMLMVPMVKLNGTLNSALLFMSIWEIMSLSSFLLIICSDEVKNVSRNGLTYLIIMHISAALLMLGFISISQHVYPGNSFAYWALFLGFGIKLGIFPFHFYMADSYETAPGASAGLISGVMINLAIYGILRTFQSCVQYAGFFGYILLATGVTGALWGVFRALAENRAKRILAGSSMENMGLILMGMGVFLIAEYVYHFSFAGRLALAGILLHSLNHSIFKSQLFYTADLIRNKCGTTDLDLLGGQVAIFRSLKKTSLIAALGISSLPPLNGFVGKFLLYASFFELMFATDNKRLILISIGCLVILGTVGALSLFVFVKFYSMIFLGCARSIFSSLKKPIENKINTFSLSLMSLLSLTLGVFPVLFSFETEKFHAILKAICFNALMIIFISLLMWTLRHLLTRNGKSKRVPTWGCGYSNITSKMEYTADSLSLPLMRLLDKLFPRRENNAPITALYPQDIERTYEVRNPIKEGIEYVCRLLNKLLGKMQFLQSGMMQSYLWISVLFLVLAIIYAIFTSNAPEVNK